VLEEGLSHRKAAARFKVSVASVSRWRALAADGAVPMQGPLGGDRDSHLVGGHADAILTVFHARRDMALAELQAKLAEGGLRFGYGTLGRFFARRGYTRKKRLRTRPQIFLSDGLAQSGSPS
jgi:transposase